MSVLDRQALEDLIDVAAEPCVSIYLPTHRAGLDYRQDPILLKNLLREAEDQLERSGMGHDQAGALLHPARELLEDAVFWKHQADGLALFLTRAGMRAYRLPESFRPLAVVNRRFHVKPLLPLLSGDGRFWLLALSQNQVRLWEGSRHGLREIELRSIPSSLQGALGYDYEQKSLQFRGARTQGGQGAMFYGGGEGDETVKQEMEAYFRIVDDGVRRLIGDGRGPLVLAAVDYEIAMYRQVSKVADIVEGGIPGNPEMLDATELHGRAWALVAPRFEASRRRARERHADLSATDRVTATLAEVLPASIDGRVETLFVALGRRRWGRYDEPTRTVTEAPGQEPGVDDLLDFTAVQALVHGAEVFAVDPADVPGGGDLAAIYRY